MSKRLRPEFRSSLRMGSASETVLELLVYDEIGENWWTGGGVTAKSVAAALHDAGDFDRIAVRVNSPGGDCFEGVAIYNLLRAQAKPVDVFVDGLAASAASVIAMAGGMVAMGDGAMIMIHNAASFAYGDAPELRKTADLLEKVSQTVGEIYVKKTGKSADDVKSLMDAETWMGPQEAIDNGFADRMIEQEASDAAQAKALAKTFNFRHCKHVPTALKPAQNSADECQCDCSACQAGDCQYCTNRECDDEHCVDCPNQQEIGSSAAQTAAQPQDDGFEEIARMRLALLERQ